MKFCGAVGRAFALVAAAGVTWVSTQDIAPPCTKVASRTSTPTDDYQRPAINHWRWNYARGTRTRFVLPVFTARTNIQHNHRPHASACSTQVPLLHTCMLQNVTFHSCIMMLTGTGPHRPSIVRVRVRVRVRASCTKNQSLIIETHLTWRFTSGVLEYYKGHS